VPPHARGTAVRLRSLPGALWHLGRIRPARSVGAPTLLVIRFRKIGHERNAILGAQSRFFGKLRSWAIVVGDRSFCAITPVHRLLALGAGWTTPPSVVVPSVTASADVLFGHAAGLVGGGQKHGDATPPCPKYNRLVVLKYPRSFPRSLCTPERSAPGSRDRSRSPSAGVDCP